MKPIKNTQIDHPALTMLLAAQEDVLERFFNNEIFKSRGLTARFFYCKPISKIGQRQYNTPKIPAELEDMYNNLLFELLSIPISKNRIPILLELDEEAYISIEAFFDQLEPKHNEEFEGMNGWTQKLVGGALRIAAILHCVKNGKNSGKFLVSANTMKRAIRFAEYFLEHAKYVYSIAGADKTLQEAKFILKKLKKQSERELRAYDIFRLCRGKFAKVYDTLSPLKMLVEYGYLKEQYYDTPTGGRPKGNTYILNPKFFDE